MHLFAVEHCQRLVKVFDDIVGVFGAHAEADEVRGDIGYFTAIFALLRVGRDGGYGGD